jgi:eukaryotic-like serine/threonine-protein kinase
LTEGDVVDGRFRLLEQVGAGGMGVVFSAHDEQTGTMVAVKVLDGQTAQQIERAHREAEVLARLSHPAIVRHIADGVVAGGSRYVAMEWIEGVTVADRLSGIGFSLAEAVIIVAGVADALASAHRAEVLHRDLKPSNIVLVEGDARRPKLIDFGVARVRDAVHALTRTGAAIGTPGYMSPEQARGERALTRAADVFGLGCVLYEIASARPAFSGTAAAAVMAKILLAEPTPLATWCPEAPRELLDVLARMLAKDVRKRIPDCGEVAAALAACGPMPPGPRRSARRQTADATRVGGSRSHIMVAAARGNVDDVLDPPVTEQRAMLAQAADAWQAQLEILATGAAVVHVTGEAKDASHRSAVIALAMRRILPGWSIAISSLAPDADTAVDQGSAMLTQATIAAIFGKVSTDRISVDPSTAGFLSSEFEVDAKNGSLHLLGQRTRDP